MKVVLYARVSTNEQTTGVSIEEQLERTEKWAQAMGHEIVGRYSDPGLSGSVEPVRRPGLNNCMECCRNKKADGIVAVSLDRYSRSLKHTIELVDWAVQHNHSLISLRESLDTTSATGRLILAVLASVNQFIREGIIEKTKAVIDYRKRHSMVSGQVPWGWERVPGSAKLQPSPQEREAFATLVAFVRLNPSAPDRVVCAWMNENFGPHPRQHKPWKRDDVFRMRRLMVKRGLMSREQLSRASGPRPDGEVYEAPQVIPGQQTLFGADFWDPTKAPEVTP